MLHDGRGPQTMAPGPNATYLYKQSFIGTVTPIHLPLVYAFALWWQSWEVAQRLYGPKSQKYLLPVSLRKCLPPHDLCGSDFASKACFPFCMTTQVRAAWSIKFGLSYTQKGIQMNVQLFLLFIYSRWYGFSFIVSNNVSCLRESGKVDLMIDFT